MRSCASSPRRRWGETACVSRAPSAARRLSTAARHAVALVSHTVRRAVFWDKRAGAVAREPEDGVLATFLRELAEGKPELHAAMVAESAGEEPLRLYAIAASRAALRELRS